MTPGPGMKTWLSRIGTLLGLVGLLFVAFRLRTYAGEIEAGGIGVGGYVALGGLALVYGTSNLLLALGWWKSLHYLDTPVSRGRAIRIYAASQLAKYVPGNIFQFAGRQVIGVATGIANKPLAKSTILELVLLIGGGALFSPLAATLIPGWVGGLSSGIAAFILLALIALMVAGWLGGATLGAAALYYFAFLAISGTIFAAAYQIAGGNAPASALPSIAGAYVLAWLAGLLTPGAPAGLGVREAVLVFLLGGVAAAPVILLAVVVGRAITVLGDVGFYLVGHITKNTQSSAWS